MTRSHPITLPNEEKLSVFQERNIWLGAVNSALRGGRASFDAITSADLVVTAYRERTGAQSNED